MPKKDKPDQPREIEIFQGNMAWKRTVNSFIKRKGGPAPMYSDPVTLMEDAAGYFEDIATNPLYEQKAWQTEGEVVTHDAPKARPMTVEGLCNWLGITSRAWQRWRNEREDLQEVIMLIDQIIHQHKVEGIAAGFFEGRCLGISGPDDARFPLNLGMSEETTILAEMTVHETARRLAFVLRMGIESAPQNQEKIIDHS